MKHLLLFIPVALVMGFVAFFAYALKKESPALPSVLLNKPLPIFSLPELFHPRAKLTSSQLKGKVVVLNVFASWCAPCQAEQPILMQLAHRPNIALYGLAYKDKPNAVRVFLGRNGNPFQAVGLDEEGSVALDLGVYGIPETFIIDSQGLIRYREAGPLTPDTLEKKILPLITTLQP